MGMMSGVLEGQLDAKAQRDLLRQVAARAREGRFGAAGRAFEVEEIHEEARGGYRDGQRIPAIRLRLLEGRRAAFDAIELDVDEAGALRYRATISFARRLRMLAPLAFLTLGASLIALVLYTFTAAPLLAAPILPAIAFMILSAISRMDTRWRSDVVTALRREIDDARIDAALEPTGTNTGIARDVVLLLESRGIALTDDERARILECDDAAVVAQWSQNARLATTASEVFDGPRVRVAVGAPAAESSDAEAEDVEEAEERRARDR